ncbi:EamA family transporter RarD [Candidatus Pelagibacter sp.]|nr:EamA family transporter RarD [Candidatus Pelagibacter sp.]
MNKEFNKGLLLTGFGSFWWGVIGVIYFKYIAFIGHIELVVHRCLWTTFTLILTTFFFSKWSIFLKIIKSKIKLFYLFISGLLIFINWGVWIYSVATNRIIDASFGYFIMPILSVMLGYFFFREKMNKKRIFSIILVFLSIIFLIVVSIKSLPWVGLIVALSWGFYNLVRKKINVDTDVGLLIESLFILPFALIIFYFIVKQGYNDFQISNPPMMLFIFLAGPMTVIPLFLYVRGVELCGLGPTGMIFYITPSFQFLLGYFYYNEPFSITKLVGFIFIWIAVIIYLKDLYETN